MAYKVEINAAPKQLQEMMQDVIDKKIDSAKELKPIPPGVLPTLDNKQDCKMYLAGPGTWTHPTMSPNLVLTSAEKAMVWWAKDAEIWSAHEKQNVKGDPGINGTNGATLSQLFNAAKVGGYAVDEKVRDAKYVEYISLANANTAALTDATKWRKNSADITIVEANQNGGENIAPLMTFKSLVLDGKGELIPMVTTSYRVTNPIEVMAGDVFEYSMNIPAGYGLVSVRDVNGKVVQKVDGTGGVQTRTITVEQKGTIIFSSNNITYVRKKVREIYKSDLTEKFKEATPNESFLNNLWVRGSGVSQSVCICADGAYNYLVRIGQSLIEVWRNAELLKVFDAGAIDTSGTTSTVCTFENKLHVLVSYSLASNPTITYFTIDLTALTIETKTSISVPNRFLGAYGMTVLGGKLLATVDVIGATNGDTNVLLSRLYELNTSGVFVEKSTIFTYGETVGEVWIDAQVGAGLANNPVLPRNTTLYVIGTNLYAITVSQNTLNQAFVKVSSDNGASWTFERALPPEIFPVNTTKVVPLSYDGKIYFLTGGYYVAKTLTNAVLIIIDYDGKNKITLNPIHQPFFDIAGAVNSNGILEFGWTNSAPNYVGNHYSASFDSIVSFFRGETANAIGTDLKPSEPLKLDARIGDYYLTRRAGTFTNFYQRVYGIGPANFRLEPIENGQGELLKIVYAGGRVWRKELLNHQTQAKTVVVARGASNNPFGTSATRIPCIIEDLDGNLVSFFDVRYTVGDDFDIIDIGMLRSFDKGVTWPESQIPMRRTENQFRMHDPSAVTDRVTKRIWVFAKQWGANVGPTPAYYPYWVANKEKMRFYAKYSDNNGVTWSALQDLTSLRRENEWHLSSGAAAGIQTRQGHLVVPVYGVLIDSSTANSAMRSSFIYKLKDSDEWVRGVDLPIGTNECQILEDDNGDLLIATRGGATRRVFRMAGGVLGTDWVEIGGLTVLNECNITFVKRGKYYIMATSTAGSGQNRTNSKIFYSLDLNNWLEVINLTGSTPSWGYCGLIAGFNNFGVIYEDGNLTLSYKNLYQFDTFFK